MINVFTVDQYGVFLQSCLHDIDKGQRRIKEGPFLLLIIFLTMDANVTSTTEGDPKKVGVIVDLVLSISFFLCSTLYVYMYSKKNF